MDSDSTADMLPRSSHFYKFSHFKTFHLLKNYFHTKNIIQDNKNTSETQHKQIDDEPYLCNFIQKKTPFKLNCKLQKYLNQEDDIYLFQKRNCFETLSLCY